MGSSLSSSSPPEEVRNWLELPPELMSMIFKKLGTVDILTGAQFVCTEWRRLCKDPHLFGSIDICNCYVRHKVELAKESVNRSCGQLVYFSIETFATNEILEHITTKRCPLRRLRLASCAGISYPAVVDMAKKLSLLEELEICNCHLYNLEEVIESFGRSCPLLKSFRLNYPNNSDRPRTLHDHLTHKVCDGEALAIAQSMPELRHLNLSGAYLTNNGLQTILDGCPHLNFLDLSLCPHLNFAGGLVHKMCVDRNIELRVSGKRALLLKLITKMQWEFSVFLKLQHEIPDYECIEAGYDGELDAACSLYTKFTNALHQTVAQLRSQYDTLSQMKSKILTRTFSEVLDKDHDQIEEINNSLLVKENDDDVSSIGSTIYKTYASRVGGRLLLDPHVSQTKGRKRANQGNGKEMGSGDSRIKGWSNQMKKPRICRGCMETGHDSRICKNNKEDNNTQSAGGRGGR